MSDKNDLSHYIPKRLDDTGKFLFWDKDVAFIALAGVLLGLAIDFPIMGLLFGMVASFYYSKLKGTGGFCRTCLVKVEQGSEKDPRPMPKLVPSCKTTVMNGMVVRNSTSSEVIEARAGVVEFLLKNQDGQKYQEKIIRKDTFFFLMIFWQVIIKVAIALLLYIF